MSSTKPSYWQKESLLEEELQQQVTTEKSPNPDILKHSCCKGTLFFYKQYIVSKKGREAKDCKQTEIVSIPIGLNRKLSQLDVYSEPCYRVQGLWREHFLASQQTDGKASGGRWQWRQWDFLDRVCND